MNILVTGGAGYVGSVCARRLVQAGHRVVVLDDLSLGHAEAVRRVGCELVRADILDAPAVLRALVGMDAVVHFAGLSLVGESVAQAERYMRINAGGTQALAQAMAQAGVGSLVFSSSAAVYGTPACSPISELQPMIPCNPYGQSKAQAERQAAAVPGGPNMVALRYFNACGATADGQLGEAHAHETHLIPRLLAQAAADRPFTIYGTDYDTPDGTCVRDYIHVEDLADAHLAAVEALADGWLGGAQSINLGTGEGNSVRQVIAAVQAAVGTEGQVAEGPRRAGDPPTLVADVGLAKQALAWQATRTMAEAVQDAWRWHQEQPYG